MLNEAASAGTPEASNTESIKEITVPAINDTTNLCFTPTRNYGRVKNITGQRFGRLLVVAMMGSRNRKTWWLCDCGQFTLTMITYLRKGETKSCGCEGPHGPITHGMNGTPAHQRWKSMNQRCHDPNHADYQDYRNRRPCQRWASFEAFFADMGHPPSPRHSIDRIRNGDGYWCGKCAECVELNHSFNCRWATSKEQSRNRSNNRMVTHQGQTFCAAEWAERLGMPYKTFHRRLQRGMSISQMLTLSPPYSSPASRRIFSNVLWCIPSGRWLVCRASASASSLNGSGSDDRVLICASSSLIRFASASLA